MFNKAKSIKSSHPTFVQNLVLKKVKLSLRISIYFKDTTINRIRVIVESSCNKKIIKEK